MLLPTAAAAGGDEPTVGIGLPLCREAAPVQKAGVDEECRQLLTFCCCVAGLSTS
jgi:hypothetical protein